MGDINNLLKVGKKGLNYIDKEDVKLTKISFPEVGRKKHLKRDFYTIEGIDDYIIKSCKETPKRFNESTNLKLLRNLIKKQGLLPEVDFPIGYFSNLGHTEGTIIPYYNAPSLSQIFYFQSFNDLRKYYNHENNDIDNLISMFLDVLTIIRKMYENKVIYTDIHSGNFVLDNNKVKIIDFDPGTIWFSDIGHFNRDIVLVYYCLFVQEICKRCNKEILLHRGEDFFDTEERVKMLRRELRG